ncbi:hypothetical protein Q8A73_012625 [Channa argus]|nr:hypothetical protein Q8A73_012625 [Channa argus]
MLVISSFNFSLQPSYTSCFYSSKSGFVFTALLITYVLVLLPLFILVLFVGYQRWRKLSSGSAAAMNSNSDIFTYNVVVQEMIGICGTGLYCYANYSNKENVSMVGIYVFIFISTGQTLFHILTCVDRYLAVVHPVTYLCLRQTGGVRIRHIAIICVWLLCIVSLCLTISLGFNFYIISDILFLTFSFVVVTFCSVSVLCVLIRPGPGEVGGKRVRTDQSKQRAFYTIITIMGALCVRLLTVLVFDALLNSSATVYVDNCLVMSATPWISLPSSLVLPLLFLQRGGKLQGCK